LSAAAGRGFQKYTPSRVRGRAGDQLIEQIGRDGVLISQEMAHVPHQSAGAWVRRAEADQPATILGDPAALATGAMGERTGQQIHKRHAPTFRLNARPIVSGDLSATGPTLERGKRHHVYGAQRAD